MRALLTGIFLSLACIPIAQCQGQFDNVEVTSTAVRGPVHVLQGAGGNIGVSVGEDGILLVDDEFAPLAPKIKAALADLQPGPVQFIVNTHWHGDHTGGNANYGDAVILSQDNVRKRLMEGNDDTEPSPPDAWPVITFDHSVTIHFNGEDIDVIHFPHAHTDGDAVVFFRGSNVVQMADLLFADQYPYVDLPSGGNVTGVLNGVEAVLAEVNQDTAIIAGHGGPVVGMTELAQYRDFLKTSIDHVRAGLAAGKTKDALMQEGMPEGFWDKWPEGWIKEDQWIGFVVDSLNRP